jgi:hypothetical protein
MRRAHPDLGAHRRLDDPSGLHDVPNVAPNDSRHLRASGGAVRIAPYATSPDEYGDRDNRQHEGRKRTLLQPPPLSPVSRETFLNFLWCNWSMQMRGGLLAAG